MTKEDIPTIEDVNLRNYLMSMIDDFEDEKEIDESIAYYMKLRKAFSPVNKRRAAHVDLNVVSLYAKPGDWLEVTEWTNGEGFDVLISTNDKDTTFQLSYDEFDAISSILHSFNTLSPTIYTE